MLRCSFKKTTRNYLEAAEVITLRFLAILKKHPWMSVSFSKVAGFSLQLYYLLKVALIRGCFLRFLNCTNGNKSRKASQLEQLSLKPTKHQINPLRWIYVTDAN